MSLNRPFAWLAALLVVLGLASDALAQHYQPFIDPTYFQPDLQFFAPAEVSAYSGGEPPNTGFYFDYDRVHINMTRPVDEASLFSYAQGDFTWGNRYELGYMTEDETGWQLVHWHINGPYEAIKLFQERLDVFNEDDEPPDDPDPIIQDRNPRQYILEDSLNQALYSSVEFNKVWRRKEFHNGTILEPIVGLRYVNFKDFYRRDDYTRFESIGPPGQPDPGTPNVNGDWEQLQSNRAIFENAMFGGQLGCRVFNQRGRWLLSGELRAFALQNYQTLNNIQFTRQTRYTAFLGDPEVELQFRTDTFLHADEFVYGGEVRAEASYELTRDINLRFGAVFIDFANGIGRGNIMLNNDQDVQMAGVTFGFTVNR